MTIENTFQDEWAQQAALDLIAKMQDPQWLQAAARIEDEANCDISAGRDWGDQLGKVLSNPAGYYQHERLRTLVFRELRQLLTECDLGVGLKAAQSVGKALIIQRLRSPSVEIQSQLMAVLAEDQASAQDIPLSASARESLRQVIQAVLLPEDWETISTAAASALQEHFRVRFVLPQTV
jgi:hypothetical protein